MKSLLRAMIILGLAYPVASCLFLSHAQAKKIDNAGGAGRIVSSGYDPSKGADHSVWR
jgi:hypothetical protein